MLKKIYTCTKLYVNSTFLSVDMVLDTTVSEADH